MNISCHMCYLSQPWAGNLVDLKCVNCGEIIPVEQMAKKLIHVFCGPTLNMPRPRGMHLLNFAKAICELAWGDGWTVGRHDWLIAGFPVTIEEFKKGLETLGGVELAALSRLMNTKPFQNLLSNHRKEICNVIKARLSGDLVRVQRADFERLIRTLGKFPSVENINFLKTIKENYLDDFIQGVVNDTLEQCQNI